MKSPRITLPRKANLRGDVAWSLFQVLERGKSSRELLDLVLPRYSKQKDRAWIQEVFYGCLRVLPKLQYWTHQSLERPLKANNKIVEHLIMQGMYQLHFMRTGDHAAVSETVNAAKILQLNQFAGLINAVLRNFVRNKLAENAIDKEHINLCFPKWLLRMVKHDHPEHWRNIIEQSDQKAPLCIRVNALKTSPQEYAQQLIKQGIEFSEIAKYGLQLHNRANVTELPGFEEGLFSIQDKAAQLASDILDAQTGDIVLDCCAAPGGKSFAIVERTPTIKQLISIDNKPNRIAQMRDNAIRLGHQNTTMQVLELDAMKLTTASQLPEFDRILLDAPCSATGVIRKHPDIKWLRKGTDIEPLLSIQQALLAQCWQKLKVGGTLVYATCSILNQENAMQVEKFLQANKNAELADIEYQPDENSIGWQILPGDEGMDGFYYAKLIKKMSNAQ